MSVAFLLEDVPVHALVQMNTSPRSLHRGPTSRLFLLQKEHVWSRRGPSSPPPPPPSDWSEDRRSQLRSGVSIRGSEISLFGASSV